MDIENAKNEFDKFVQQYDLKNERINYKISHSYRVMDRAEEIAKSLNLPDEEIELAKLIGLLHDIGRFEQVKIFATFRDHTSIDHGDLGVEILQKDNYIRKYNPNSTYDSIIYKAIKNHNKFKIEDGLSEKELLFSKIVRDADKLDIFYEGTKFFWEKPEKLESINNSKISNKVLKEFENNTLIDRRDIITEADSILSYIAFMYDINFKYDFKILKKERYLNIIIDKFDFKDEETAIKMKHVKQIVNEYIEKQL